MLLEAIKFIIYSMLIVIISKYILVTALRKLAENLGLQAKTAGDIAGFATSTPELLTICTLSIRRLPGASIYNLLSSNIINLVLYLTTIIINKNTKKLKNNAIKTDIILVAITILIPMILLKTRLELNISIVPLFIILYIFFAFLNNNAHKLYLSEKKQQMGIPETITTKNKKTIKYIFILVITGVLLFLVGELLGNTLENLCNLFNVPQIIVGVLLGFITSLPELITFFEAQREYKKTNDDILRYSRSNK